MLRLPLGVLRTRAVATTARCYGARYTSRASSTKSPLSRTVLKWTLAGTGLGIGLTATGLGVALYQESNLRATAEREGTRPPTPLRELLRTYVVYGLCSFPTLVDWSPTILSTLLGIPLVNKITEAVVRVTFFDQVCLFISSMFLGTEISVQFVGADTADACIPLLHKLRAENKGCLFAYSVEVDENEAAASRSAINLDASDLHLPPHKRAVQEMLESIDVAANFEDSLGEGHGDALSRKTWVAIKLVRRI
jgi:proline dehydrogenase